MLKRKDLKSLRYKPAAVSDKVREECRCFQTTQFLPAGFLISSSLWRIRSRFLRFLGQSRFKFPPPDTAKNAAVSSLSPKGRPVGSLAQLNCVENTGTASFTLENPLPFLVEMDSTFLLPMETTWPYLILLDFRGDQGLHCAWRPGRSQEAL